MVFQCSGQVNCPCAKVFAAGETACMAQKRRRPLAGLVRPQTCAESEISILTSPSIVGAKPALLRRSFFPAGQKNVIRPLPCSSSPNRTRCAGLRFGGAANGRPIFSFAEKISILTSPSSSSQATYHLRRAFSFHCKAYRSLILPLLSSKPDPLRWAPAWGRPAGGCFCPRKNIGFDRPFHVVAKFAL